jgi:hypothetical protein
LARSASTALLTLAAPALVLIPAHQAEKLNGRAAMVGYFMALFVDQLTGVGLLDQQNSFFGKVLLHVCVFGILLVRCALGFEAAAGARGEALQRAPGSGLLRRAAPGACVCAPGANRSSAAPAHLTPALPQDPERPGQV